MIPNCSIWSHMYCYQLCLKLNCRPKIKCQVVPLTASRFGESKMPPSFSFSFPTPIPQWKESSSTLDSSAPHICLVFSRLLDTLKLNGATAPKDSQSRWLVSWGMLWHSSETMDMTCECLWLDRTSALLWALQFSLFFCQTTSTRGVFP